MYKLYDYSKTYASDLEAIAAQSIEKWNVNQFHKGRLVWYSFELKTKKIQYQGWKIHISLQAINYAKILDIVKFLLAEEVHFKIPGDLETICYINSGDSGDSQMGKIFTVYPSHEAQLIDLVQKLDTRIPHSLAPLPPSDLFLRSDGAISIRYGVFNSDLVCYDENDLPYYGLKKPNLSIVPDERRMDGLPPQWVNAPDIKLHSQKNAIDLSPIKQYLPLALLHKRNHSQVFLGMNTESFKNIIIKKTAIRTGVDLNNYNGRDRLLNEFNILKQLSKISNITPEAFEFIEGDDSISIIIEDLEGKTFNQLSKSTQITYLNEVLRAIIQLHDMGFVHRDIKLSNVILTGTGIKLIDFELSCAIGKEMFILGGTKNFIPPERDFSIAHPKYDSYAIGSCLTHIVLEKEPSTLPQALEQRVDLLAILGYTKIARLVEKSCAENIEERLSSSEILIELSQLDTSDFYPKKTLNNRYENIQDSLWYAKSIYSASLSTKNYRIIQGDLICWRNEHSTSEFLCEGINTGAAGIILGLTLTSKFSKCEAIFEEDILGGVRWLVSKNADTIPKGLFTGSAGIALVLGLVGQVFNKGELLEQSKYFLKKAIKKNQKTDFFGGLAGVIYSGCVLFDLYNDKEFLAIVAPGVEQLTSTVFRYKEEGVVVWPRFLGKNRIDQNPSIGAAHGSAGIALALGLYAQKTQTPEIKELAEIAMNSIFKYGRNTSNDSLFLDAKTEKTTSNNIWCHGAAGYLWCLLQLPDSPEKFKDEIQWSADLFLKSNIIDNPTYCHGLSGQLETLRLLQNVKKYRKLASLRIHKIKAVLKCIHQKRDDKVVWYSENPNIITPDLWTGFSGTAASLALNEMDSTSTLLSLKWLDKKEIRL